MPMNFTGERYVPELGGEIRLEHMHRYAFCLPYVKGKSVLDAACGEGYGSALIAGSAASVVGVDISPEAVDSARERYCGVPGLEFRQGDATALELPDQSFDVVVSFETIEHVHDQEGMMRGFARVLKPGGLLILSSPDKRTYSDLTGYRNEFHVHELYRSELEELVQRHFKRSVLLGQRLAGGSAIFPLDSATGLRVRNPTVYVDGEKGPVERAATLDAAVYLLVLAANGGPLPSVQPSLMLSEQQDPLMELKQIARWASGLHNELTQARADAANEVSAARQWAEAERVRVAQMEAQLAEMAERADQEMQRVRKDMTLRIASQLQQRDAHIARLESELSQERAASAALSSAAAERERAHSTALAAMQAELEAARSEAGGMETRSDLLQRAVEEARHRANVAETALAELRLEEDAEAQARASMAARESSAIAALEAQLAELRQERAAAAAGSHGELEQLQFTHAEALAEVADLKRRLALACEERDASSTFARNLQRQVAERMAAVVGGFPEQVQKLSEQVAEQSLRLGEAQRREVELSRALERLNARHEQLLADAAATRTLATAAEIDLKARQQALRSELDAANADRTGLTLALDELRQQRDEELLRRESEVRAASLRSEIDRANWQAQLDEVKKALDTAREAESAARRLAKDTEQQLLARLQAMSADNTTLRARASESETQHALEVERLVDATAAAQAALKNSEAQILSMAEAHAAELQRISVAREAEAEVMSARVAALENEQAHLRDELISSGARHAEELRMAHEETQWLRSELTKVGRRRSEIELALQRQADDTRRRLHDHALKMREVETQAQAELSGLRADIRNAIREVLDRLAQERRLLSGPTAWLGGRSRRLFAWLSARLSGVLAMLPIDEPRPATLDGPVSLGRALRLSDAEFLHEAYRAVLGRQPDEDGLAHYSELLRRGEHRLRVLAHLRLSPEGQARPPAWRELDEALEAHRASRWPLLGRAEARRLRELTADRPRIERAEPAFGAPSHERRLASIESTLNELASGSSLLAEAVPLSVALGRAPAELGIDAWACAKELVRLTDEDFVRLSWSLMYKSEVEEVELRRACRRLAAGASRAYLIETLMQGQAGPEPAGLPRSRGLLALGSDGPLPCSGVPRVSIVIPVFGQIEYTMRCLRAVARHTGNVPIEVIVVDDASPDETQETLAGIPGLRLLRNEANLGFVDSCNRGAAEARGELLCFLNNDTEVTRGWLEELCRTFEVFPGTGLVGAKLIYPDGQLQEAGSVLFSDGSAANIGRYGNAEDAAYNYAREVDYCSGACILVPRHLFEAVGGFDERFAPAYCEDSDLALKIASRGYRIVYQPRALVVHHEGVTAGIDVGSGAKAYQVINTAKLLERWRDRLSGYATPGSPVEVAISRRRTRRLLAIELRLPRPDRDAGSMTVLNMLLLLREMGFAVTLMVDEPPSIDDADAANAVALLQRVGVEVLLPPQTLSVLSHLELSGREYELALVFRPVVLERHAATLRRRCATARLLYYPHDLHFLRLQRQAQHERNDALSKEADQWRERELRLLKQADLTLVPSRVELELLLKETQGARIELLPLQLDTTRGPESRAGRSGMLFVGHFAHPPNIDALLMLLEEVLPRLRMRRQDIELTVVGEALPQEIIDRRDSGFNYLGPVTDLAPVFARALVGVAPLRFGAGAKGKVARAMAAGLPVVASSLAVEGMDLVPDQHVLIADSADAVVGEVLRLKDDEVLWHRMADAGHRLACQLWGARRSYDSLGAALATIGSPIDPPKYPPRLFREDVFLPQAVESLGLRLPGLAA